MLIEINIPLGATVRDRLSNYEGIVTSIQLQAFSSTVIGVTREGLDEMDTPYEPEYFTEKRLEILSDTTELEEFGYTTNKKEY